jgi:hypothetical protein
MPTTQETDMDRTKGSSTRPAGQPFRIIGWMAVVGMLALALVGPSVLGAAANDTPGNNGTVKIHEGATETEPGPQNEPHVCTFHLHFFFADPEQAGTWEIQEWSPGDKGVVVRSGTYDTMGDVEDREPDEGVYTLPDGHYKLFWDGDLDTDKHDKHKVFWVECEAPTGSEEPTGSQPNGSQPNGSQPTGSQPTGSQPTGSELPIESQPTGSQPTGSELPIESQPTGSEQPSLSGGVGGLTGAPVATLPPTDELPASAPTGTTWQALLIAMAALLAAILVLTPSQPAPQHIRRR